MGSVIGVFTDTEVTKLSEEQKLDLRADVISALKGPSGLGELRERLRKDLGSKFGITLES